MAQGEAKQITVKLRKGGWEVEITCSESQLKAAMDSVLSSLTVQGPMVAGPSSGEITSDAASKTCRGLIVELWQDSWFTEGRTLGQVHEEIARRGYHYDRTAVSHALRDLVLENILTRQGFSRNYTYIQKRPPGAPYGESQPPQFSSVQPVAGEQQEEDEE